MFTGGGASGMREEKKVARKVSGENTWLLLFATSGFCTWGGFSPSIAASNSWGSCPSCKENVIQIYSLEACKGGGR